MPFGMEKLECCGYQMVKIIRSLFVLTESTNVTYGQTDTDTAWRLRPRLHSIARQKSPLLWAHAAHARKRQTGGQTNLPALVTRAYRRRYFVRSAKTATDRPLALYRQQARPPWSVRRCVVTRFTVYVLDAYKSSSLLLPSLTTSSPEAN